MFWKIVSPLMRKYLRVLQWFSEILVSCTCTFARRDPEKTVPPTLDWLDEPDCTFYKLRLQGIAVHHNVQIAQFFQLSWRSCTNCFREPDLRDKRLIVLNKPKYFDSDSRTTTVQIYKIHIMWNSIVVCVKISQVLFQRQLRFNNRSELSLQRLYVAHHLDNWPGSIAALVSKYSNPNSRFGLLCFHIYCPLHSMRQFTSAEIGWGCKQAVKCHYFHPLTYWSLHWDFEFETVAR